MLHIYTHMVSTAWAYWKIRVINYTFCYRRYAKWNEPKQIRISTRNFVAGAIVVLTAERELIARLAVSVYISCRSPARRDAYDRLCFFIRKEVEKKWFTEIVLLRDRNTVSFQTHSLLLAREVSSYKEYLQFRRATRFPRRMPDGEAVLITSFQSKVRWWESKRPVGMWTSRKTTRQVLICPAHTSPPGRHL